MICCRFFKVLKCFDVDILVFQFKLFMEILAFFGVEIVWATFLKNWVIFFKSSGHPTYRRKNIL